MATEDIDFYIGDKKIEPDQFATAFTMDISKATVYYGYDRPAHGEPGDIWVLPVRGGRQAAFLAWLAGQKLEKDILHVWRDGDWREMKLPRVDAS